MSTRFFGDFLLERRLATPGAIAEASRRMREVNQTVAGLAQERGWLTAAQIELIHSEQLRHNRFWGEQGIELGLLDAAQVARLLADQRARHLRLGEALLELGLIEREVLERALAEFAEERLRELARPRELPASLERCGAARHVLDHFQQLTLRIARLPTRLGEAREWKADAEPELGARVALRGDVGLEVGIAVERRFGVALAEGWLRHSRDDLDRALLLDLLGELLNIVVGNAKSQLEANGVACELGIPEHDALPEAGTAIELAAPSGRGCLILSLR